METSILQFFEQIRSPALTAFFAFFSAVGEETVIAAVVAVIYVCFSRRAGEQALLTVLSASCFTTGWKGAVRRTRPYAAGAVSLEEVDLPIVSTAESSLDADMSFPSGHTSASAAVFAQIPLQKKGNRLLWGAVSFLVVFLIACSRLYFGVHYPSDVFAGFVCGAAIAVLWHEIYAHAYVFRIQIFGILSLLAVPLLFIPATATESMFRILALCLAAAAALPLEQRFARIGDTNQWGRRVLRLLLTAAAAAVPFLPLYFLLPEGNWATFFTYFAAVFSALFSAPLAIKKLRL